VEDEATTKARELSPVFADLRDWGERHWPEANEGFDDRDDGE